jgi:hypothetical protein
VDKTASYKLALRNEEGERSKIPKNDYVPSSSFFLKRFPLAFRFFDEGVSLDGDPAPMMKLPVQYYQE